MAVNIGARVSAKAGPGEVLVTSTVKDLVPDRTCNSTTGAPPS